MESPQRDIALQGYCILEGIVDEEIVRALITGEGPICSNIIHSKFVDEDRVRVLKQTKQWTCSQSKDEVFQYELTKVFTDRHTYTSISASFSVMSFRPIEESDVMLILDENSTFKSFDESVKDVLNSESVQPQRRYRED